jgi:hypothetical protein
MLTTLFSAITALFIGSAAVPAIAADTSPIVIPVHTWPPVLPEQYQHLNEPAQNPVVLNRVIPHAKPAPHKKVVKKALRMVPIPTKEFERHRTSPTVVAPAAAPLVVPNPAAIPTIDPACPGDALVVNCLKKTEAAPAPVVATPAPVAVQPSFFRRLFLEILRIILIGIPAFFALRWSVRKYGQRFVTWLESKAAAVETVAKADITNVASEVKTTAAAVEAKL